MFPRLSRSYVSSTLVLIPLLALLGGCGREKIPAIEAGEARVRTLDEAGNSSNRSGGNGGGRRKGAASGKDAASARSAEERQAGVGEEDSSTSPVTVITGKVTLKGGEPAAGAVVSIVTMNFNEGRMKHESVTSTTAAADGRYRLEKEWEASTTYLRATLDGYVPGFGMAHFNSYSAQKGNGRRMEVNVTLQPASHVRGRVIGPDGQGVADARVIAAPVTKNDAVSMAENAETSTSADGSFSLEAVREGEVALAALSGRFVTTTQTATAPAENVVIQLAGEGAQVEGTVSDYMTRENIAGATVTLFMANEGPGRSLLLPVTVQTDQQGRFRFERLAAGRYMISAAKEKLALLPQADGKPFTFPLASRETTSGLVLYLYPGHTVTGVVREKGSGAPLAGVKVSAGGGPKAREKGVETDSEGRFRLTNVNPSYGSTAYISAEKEDFVLERENQYQQLTVQLRPDKLEVEKDLTMVRTITVSGVVRTEKGKPVAGATVDRFGSRSGLEGPGKTAMTTNREGRYKLTVQPFTRLRVKVDARGYPVTFSDLVEVDDRSTSMDITVKAGATVSGQVVDQHDSPAGEAKVKAYMLLQVEPNSWHHADLGEATAGPDGAFRYDLLPPGEVRLTAEKKGHAKSKLEKLPLSPGESRTDVKLALRQGHFIAGRVTDETSKPLSGASIYVYGQGEDSVHENARTDEEGRYRIEGLPEGKFQVQAGHEKGNESQRDVKVDRDDVDFTLGKDGDTGTVIGLVVDAKTKAPVRDFTVESTYAISVEKDGAVPGRFVAKKVRRGYGYRVTVKGKDYITQEFELPSLPEGKNTIEGTFPLGQGGTIVGRAVERGAKKPLAGVRVILKGVGDSWQLNQRAPVATAVTDEQGRFLLEKVAAGKNNLVLRPEKPLIDLSLDPEVVHGETTDLGDVEFGSGGTLKGRVVRMPGETPVPAARLSLSVMPWRQGGPGYEGVTDKDGVFEIKGIVASDYSVSLSNHGLSERATVVEGEVAEVTFRLGSAVLKGTVLERGVPVPQVNVTLTLESGGGSRSARTDGEGKFTLSDLMPGMTNVALSIWDNGRSRTGRDTVELVAGETLEKTFKLNSGVLAGRVVDQAGKPVDGAVIEAKAQWDSGERSVSLRTNSQADGTWKLASVRPGEYTAVAHKNGHGDSPSVRMPVPEDGSSPETELRLGPPTEGGTLVSLALAMKDGKPVRNAWVKLKKPDGTEQPTYATRGDDGVMTIEGIPAGTYDVEVSSWGYSISNHPGTQITVGETVSFEDVLYECGSLDWTLVDKEGKPLKDVPVRFAPNDPGSIEAVREGKTNEKGTYSTRGISPGNYTATASPAGKPVVTLPVTIGARQGAEPKTVVE